MTLAAKVHGVKGGYSDFSHLTEFKNIHVYMTEMPIYEKKKKDKSSTTKNYEIWKDIIFDGVPLNGYVPS